MKQRGMKSTLTKRILVTLVAVLIVVISGAIAYFAIDFLAKKGTASTEELAPTIQADPEVLNNEARQSEEKAADALKTNDLNAAKQHYTDAAEKYTQAGDEESASQAEANVSAIERSIKASEEQEDPPELPGTSG